MFKNVLKDLVGRVTGGDVANVFRSVVTKAAASQVAPVFQDHFRDIGEEGRVAYAKRLERTARELREGDSKAAGHAFSLFVGEIRL